LGLRIILLILFFCIPVQATNIDLLDINSIDDLVFVNAARKSFEDELAANLFANNAENQSAYALRKNILQYMKSIDHKIPNHIIEKKWDDYISKFYIDESKFDKKITDLYLNKIQVKNKFIENLYLADYFNKVVRERVLADLSRRKRSITSLHLDIAELDFREYFLQFVETLGGQQNFQSFLSRYSLSINDLLFIAQSNLCAELLEKQNLRFPRRRNTVTRLTSSRTRLQRRSSPNYYFRQAYISKTHADALLKLTAARATFVKVQKIIPSDGIEVEDIIVPIQSHTDLYAPNIKEAVIGLQSGSENISQIVESDKAYHLFQLTKVENVLPKTFRFRLAKI
jgi:hypothetical protein